MWASESAHVTWLRALSGLSGENDKRVIKVLCDRIGEPPPPGAIPGWEEAVQKEKEAAEEAKRKEKEKDAYDDESEEEEDTALEGGKVDLWVVRRTAADCVGEVAIPVKKTAPMMRRGNVRLERILIILKQTLPSPKPRNTCRYHS